MSTLTPDPRNPDEWPDAFVIWDWRASRYTDPVDLMMQDARDALTMLAVIRGFERDDLALIAGMAEEDKEWADAMEARLEEDTGIKFHLTARQWGVIALELNRQGGV